METGPRAWHSQSSRFHGSLDCPEAEAKMGSDSNLSNAVVAALPKDPDQQLQVAQQVVQYAVSSRVAKLEAETSGLRSKLAEKDAVIGSLQTRVMGAETLSAETTAKLALAMESQKKLAADNNTLSGQVKKLMSQVKKLDEFKKALMKALEDDPDDSEDGGKKPCPPASPCGSSLSPEPKDTSPPYSKREIEGPFSCRKEDCPDCPDCEPELVAADKSVGPDAIPEERASSTQSPWHLNKSPLGPLTPRFPSDSHFGASARSPRVDGKEFFRQARNRLSYEQFSEFLTNIKELNAHRQTREETKQKSSVIFGPDNFDLTEKFTELLSRYITPPLPDPPPSNLPGEQPAGLKPCPA